MAEDHISRERSQGPPPLLDAPRVDELIREAEEAVLNTKRFLEGLQESNVGGRRQIGEMRDRFEKNLKGLLRRQEQEDQI